MREVLKRLTLLFFTLTGCPVAANTQVGPTESSYRSYIVRQDSVWVWYHAPSAEPIAHDTVIALTGRLITDSIVHSFPLVFSSGRDNVIVGGAAWESSLPSDVVRVASLKPPIVVVSVAGGLAQATSASYSTGSIVYLNAYAIGRILANPKIEMRADVQGDGIVVNGTQYGQTAATVVVEPGEERIRLVDPETRDTLSAWSVTLVKGQRLCYYFHRRERRVGRCPAS
jgi:PEGA domain-containing protein